jgi:peptidoglycan/LPS O-acetylase OafA/YrhL
MNLSNPHSPHPKYRPDIDGLRALAILSVVGFHVSHERIPGGFIGVDIFFVISGFLISTIIFKGLEAGNFSFIEFYSRRIKRIYPALIIVLSFVFLAGWFTLLPEEYKQLGKHVAGGGVFISNILLWNESGYFDSAAETKPLLHLWSLAIEEQFYIFWPLLLAFVWKRKWSFITITSTVGTISFVINICLLIKNPATSFYLPAPRFWELMVGGILAYIELHKPYLNSKFKNTQSILGLALLIIGFTYINQSRLFPGWWALLPVFGAFFIISAGPKAWINNYLLSNRVVVWFGLISFPLYLWHWPLLSFARILYGGYPSGYIKVTLVFIAIFLSYITYIFLEKPIRSSESPKYRKKEIYLIVILGAIAIFGYVTYLKDGFLIRSINNNQAIDANYASQQIGTIRQEFATNEICRRRYPFDLPEANHFFCVQNNDVSPTLILLGNSFANHHYPGLTSNEHFKNQTVLSVGICDFPELKTKTTEGSGNLCESNYVAREQEWIADIIRNNKTIKYAIVDGLQSNPSSEYIKGVKSRIDFLESHDIKVIVFMPHYIPYFDIRDCIPTRFSVVKSDCKFNISELNQYLQGFNPVIKEISKTNPKVLFFNQNVLFCNGNDCSYSKNKIPLSRDMQAGGRGGHYSIYASQELTRLFVDWAKQNIPEILD